MGDRGGESQEEGVPSTGLLLFVVEGFEATGTRGVWTRPG